MKKLFLLLLLTVLIIAGCTAANIAPPSSSAVPPDTPPVDVSPSPEARVEISLTFNHRSGIASNQFAVWIENGAAGFVKTLFVTRFTAEGGWELRPDALPVWVERSGLGAGSAGEADAYTGATPKTGRLTYAWDCTDESGQPVPAGDYHFLVEGTIFWQDAVLHEGVITVGGTENTAQAEAQYTTDAARDSNMLTAVEAAYRP